MTFSNLENKCEIEQNLVGMYCLCVYEHANCMDTPCIGGSKGGGGRDARPLPLGDQILSFLCSLQQRICKIIPIWELAQPPRENPGSVTAMCCCGVETCIQQIFTECIKFLIHWSNTFTISAGYL